jgi:hypothetical protein
MVPTRMQRPIRRSLMVAVAAGVTLAIAVVGVGALGSHEEGSAATVTRPAGSVQGVARTAPRAAPVPLPSGPAMAPPTDAPPQRVFEDWQINEMNARHPEP